MDVPASVVSVIVWLVVCFCVFCPPKYDPAIRAKVRREQKAGRWPKDE
jgi:hypothetical protein